jgi:phosphate transport system substrate-binding protein
MQANTRRTALAATVLAIGLAVATPAARADQVASVDPKLTQYQVTGGISGSLSSVGSDTLNNLMTFWSEKFGKFYPNVKIQVEGKGSSTAPPALIAGTSQLGPMSRTMKNTEIDDFENKFGYKPTPVRVAVDSLAVFVNKDNPIKCLSIPQVDAIFSKSRRSGYKEDVKTWGQVGLTEDWASRPISLYGRNSASGTYGNGDYKDEVKEQPGSASVVQGVTVDRFGIGYSGIGYATPGVRAVPLSKAQGGECEEATKDNAYSGKYPIARFLYIYVNKPTGKPLEPLTREFVKMVLSKEGQEEVVKDGYFPLPLPVLEEDVKKVD